MRGASVSTGSQPEGGGGASTRKRQRGSDDDLDKLASHGLQDRVHLLQGYSVRTAQTQSTLSKCTHLLRTLGC